MATEFRLPELAEGVDSAEVTRILVAKGDTIEEDQPVIELETGKATAEIPSSVAGTVDAVRVKEGDEVNVGDVILTVTESDAEGGDAAPKEEDARETAESAGGGREKEQRNNREKRSEKKTQPADAGDDGAAQPRGDEKPVAGQPAGRDMDKAAGTITRDTGAGVPAAPSVRRFAREIGIDISEVHGSGDHGRVFIDDVKAYARDLNAGGRASVGTARSPASGAGTARAPRLPDFERWGPVRREKRSMVQRETEKQMSLAWRLVPHVTQFDVADITDLEGLRQRYKEKAEKAGGKLTITPMLAKVVGSGLKAFPRFNCSIDVEQDQLIYKDYCHLGIAVDTERGLLVPVVRNINQKNMIELAVEMQAIAERARDGKIKADELEGGTFTLTNLGGIGGTHFTPIVNWPQVAILGVGRAYRQPTFRKAVCEPRLLLPLSLSYDHRVINGADGARFLRWIAEALEEPLLMALEG